MAVVALECIEVEQHHRAPQFGQTDGALIEPHARIHQFWGHGIHPLEGGGFTEFAQGLAPKRTLFGGEPAIGGRLLGLAETGQRRGVTGSPGRTEGSYLVQGSIGVLEEGLKLRGLFGVEVKKLGHIRTQEGPSPLGLQF